MTTKRKYWQPISVLFIFGIIVIVHEILLHINNQKHKDLISHEKMYCYQTYFHGVINPAFYVKDKENIDSLKDYYKKMERGNLNPFFNFPPLMVRTDTCVYVLGYSKDSTFVKIIFFYAYKGRHFSETGYVYGKTLHKDRMLLSR